MGAESRYSTAPRAALATARGVAGRVGRLLSEIGESDMVRVPMSLNPARFPLASSYLLGLPSGLESFADCNTRSEGIEPHLRDFGKFADEPALPKAIAEMLRPRAHTRWVSEVGFQAMNLVVRDLGFQTDEAFFDWTYTASQTIFDKPFVRALMRLMSPTLVVIGASKRWAAFHQGSQLTAGAVTESGGRVASTVVLKYPPGLFPNLFLRSLERSFLAALAGSRGKEVRVELGTVKPGLAEYRVSFAA